MSLTSEWHELRDQLQALKTEWMSCAPECGHDAATSTPDPKLARLNNVLAKLERGLYPVCETCGERIEIDRLRADAFETTCWSCAKRQRRVSPKRSRAARAPA